VRPLLCRLCECPVAEGGVPLSHIDRPKLSEWWLKHLDTELDEEDSRDAWICQFCIWDARLIYFNFHRQGYFEIITDNLLNWQFI